MTYQEELKHVIYVSNGYKKVIIDTWNKLSEEAKLLYTRFEDAKAKGDDKTSIFFYHLYVHTMTIKLEFKKIVKEVNIILE